MKRKYEDYWKALEKQEKKHLELKACLAESKEEDPIGFDAEREMAEKAIAMSEGILARMRKNLVEMEWRDNEQEPQAISGI